MTDPAKATAKHLDDLRKQAQADRARANTTAARDEYTNRADGGHYVPDDPTTDLGGHDS